MDADFNSYDSFQPVTDHPTMSRSELMRAYFGAWREFYTIRQIGKSISRVGKSRLLYARLVLWYRLCAVGEKIHPMIGGFYRIKRYADRRPNAPPISRFRHAVNEVGRHVRYMFVVLRELIHVGLAFAWSYLPARLQAED